MLGTVLASNFDPSDRCSKIDNKVHRESCVPILHTVIVAQALARPSGFATLCLLAHRKRRWLTQTIGFRRVWIAARSSVERTALTHENRVNRIA